MFSSTLTRVSAHRSTTSAVTALVIPATSTPVTRARGQRRPSSSKASCPPDSSKPTSAAKAVTDAGTASQPVPRKRNVKSKRVTTLSRNKEPVDQFAGLPSVAGVQLHQSDFGLSSFFSLHRPLSLTTTIPPPSSIKTFNSLFEPQSQSDAWENGNSAEGRPEDVIYTLNNTIKSLESRARAGDFGDLREALRGAESVDDKQLEGVAPKSLDELVASFRPFRAPPPPEAFVEEKLASSNSEKKPRKSAARQSMQKNFTITIGVTESTTSDGQRTYTASPGSIFELPSTSTPVRAATNSVRQPITHRIRRRSKMHLGRPSARILERMREPGAVIRRAPGKDAEKMELISVKRQRKLKMKKHKYKKLMKRTRNLRRRQDRA